MKTNCPKCRGIIKVDAGGVIGDHYNPIDPPVEFRSFENPKFCPTTGEQYSLNWDGKSMVDCPKCGSQDVFLDDQGRLFSHRDDEDRPCDFSGQSPSMECIALPLEQAIQPECRR